MSELTGGVQSPPRWFERVDVRGLGDYSRRAILERVRKKLGLTYSVLRIPEQYP